MTFFENQAKARRKTLLLVCLYVLSVISLITGVYLSLAVLIQMAFEADQRSVLQAGLWNRDLFAAVTTGLAAIMLAGTAYKVFQLRKGGHAVAGMLGGRLIMPDTSDFHERRVLNVVEEMSIASGVQVPPVYVLEDEQSINAFAAGFSPNSAVIGITRGAVELLNRDELQGVIAHEFSHILNGDMRLNIRLMGVLHGILVVALTGYTLIRLMSSSRPRRASRDDKGGGLFAFLLAAGIALMVLGYIGVFFAGLIRMAVSRQREYLADASAVQFTRNPRGLSGALKKIGGLVFGSQVAHRRAAEASHMYFADGLKNAFFELFSTHPPLLKRIKALEPEFKGEYRPVDYEESSAAEGAPRAVPEASLASSTGRTRIQIEPEKVLNEMGSLQNSKLSYAASLFAAIPAGLRERARDPRRAEAVIYRLLLDSDDSVRRHQLENLLPSLDDGLKAELERLCACDVQPLWRLPLVELSLPALQILSQSRYRAFRAAVERLICCDQRVSLFEYVLKVVVEKALDRRFGTASRRSFHAPSRAETFESTSQLLFALAFLGSGDKDKALAAYHAGLEHLGRRDRINPPARLSPSLELIDDALDVLQNASPMFKKQIIEACIACISCDNTVTVSEAELIRAISSSLDCPLPPLTPGF